MSVISFLQKHGLMPRVFLSEMDAAESEDVLRTKIENTKAVDSASQASMRNHQANGRLRESIRKVRLSSAFSDFERAVQRDR